MATSQLLYDKKGKPVAIHVCCDQCGSPLYITIPPTRTSTVTRFLKRMFAEPQN